MLDFIDIIRVVEDATALEPLIDRPLAEPIAVRADHGWILLDERALDALLRAMRSGRSPADVLADWPATPTVPRDVEPSVPSLVIERGRVVGAWLTVSPPLAPPPRPRRRGGRPASPRLDTATSWEVLPGRSYGAPAPEAESPEPERPPAESASAPEPEAPAAPVGQTLERTPHLDAPERIAKAPGTDFTVSVYADSEAQRAGETGEGIAITLPAGVERVEVAVLLQVTPHFEVLGRQFGELVLAAGEPASERLEFRVRVTPSAPASDAGIGALFNYRGRSCGYVSRAWTWDTAEPEASSAAAEPSAPTSMPVHADAKAPDLSVYVTAPVNDGVNYMCAVETPLLEGYRRATSSRPFAVPAQGYEFLKKLLRALVDEDKSPERRLRALTEIGHEAFEAAPGNFQELLWALVDAGRRPETIYIASSQPTLPWELMIPRRFDGKEPRRLGPLGTEFAIGRWTRGDVVSPPQALPVENSFVIAPEYESEARQLDASGEIGFVERRLRGRRVKPATVDRLDRRFRTEHATLLHFICHGAAGEDDDDAIWLDGDEQLRAREMETLDGFAELCEASQPLVFMNSCETGQSVPSLAGGSGFPRSFGNLGARAVIAPLWPVDDALAARVALELYESALAPDAPPLATILRDMRRRGYAAKDVDTFAAYCFYGDPLARLRLVDS